jgi:hypothetical protein
MSKSKTAGRDFDASHCSSRAFKVGDLVILNDVEQPCGRMVCVVTGTCVGGFDYYHVQYLNADSTFDSYCKPPMQNMLKRATRLEDFGVVFRNDGTHYWCEQIGNSSATYPDGEPRKWQEFGGPIKYTIRSSALPYMGK